MLTNDNISAVLLCKNVETYDHVVIFAQGVATFLHTACHKKGVIMAYSAKAKELRRCKATRRDGQPCQAWAIWGTQRCAGPTYKRRRKSNGVYREWTTNAPACSCVAYAWPHRPGSGLCNWPDPPKWRSTIPAGTHSFYRTFKRRYRVLVRRYGMGL
jgi:hypothetical protein